MFRQSLKQHREDKLSNDAVQDGSGRFGRIRNWLIIIALVIAFLWAAGYGALYYFSDKMEDAAAFESEIAAFEEQDAKDPPAPGQILFIGSSSIRFWESLERDMQPRAVINRGFGGSMLHHSTHFAERIIFPYEPSAIVLYAGDNDMGSLTSPRSADQVAKDFDAFVAKVRSGLGPVPIFYIAIKPSTLREEQWPEMQKFNGMIADRTEQDPSLHFIDIATPMLNSEGTPKEEYLAWDGLHLNEKGYALWTKIVREALDEGLGNVERRTRDSA